MPSISGHVWQLIRAGQQCQSSRISCQRHHQVKHLCRNFLGVGKDLAVTVVCTQCHRACELPGLDGFGESSLWAAMMLSMFGCSEEDVKVDVKLGYPRVYAKLCRHEDAAGLPIPFTESPPQRFLPYAPHAEDFQHLKDWDSLFPVVAEKERDSSNIRKSAEELWQQLDHLGNAGFDPSKFRVDSYGNVVYWNADPSSPLAWDIDHWFPSSRGGRTQVPNLRIVQWQAFLRKRNRLEFLVPWWDLQHGCSINQFLSAFAAKNADFRKRSFALFFAGGEDESVAKEHVGECRPWPQHFREKKALCGLAAAAVVNISTTAASNGAPATKEAQLKRDWTVEEEEAVKRGVSKFGRSSWNEIRADDPTLSNRSAVQIKEKFRLMRVVPRSNGTSPVGSGRTELGGRQSAATTALQKELRVKIMLEDERWERLEEITQLEETVVKLKAENEKERVKALELEAELKKRKHRVEKQRKLTESRSSYRLCLERVLRDTMHQAVAYKEQAELTQEACNVLIAHLDSQKALCEAMESELLQRHATRETLEVAASGEKIAAETRGRDLVNLSSCVSLRAMEAANDHKDDHYDRIMSALSEDEVDDAVPTFTREHQRKSLVRHAIKEYLTQPRTRVRRHEERSSSQQQQCNADNQIPDESSSDSDFADDEMSPAPQICNIDEDSRLVKELCKFYDGPISELRDFCIRNSKPGDRDYAGEAALDTPTAGTAGETSRSDSKREVQKDVIMVQSETLPDTNAAMHKQAYLDELLQHIRFQIPTPEIKGQTIQAHVDELLEQVLTTHLENMRGRKNQQQNADTDNEEKVKRIGKSNLDKWLQALLVKGMESAGSSPGRSSPRQLLSPALSHINLVAMRESLERARQQELVARDGDRPKSLRGALLRKLSVKHHQPELESAIFSPKDNYDDEQPRRAVSF